ncbi:MAG TPA: TIGR02996 domain-containing protein [Kofleriaceae bacterium]
MKRVLAAIRTGDLAATRAALIAAWRANRSPALAELVALVDSKAPPDDVTTALAAIIGPRAVESEARLKLVAKLDDPRVTGFAIDALAKPPFTTPNAQRLFVALAKLAGRDPRLALRADAIREALKLRIGRAAVRTAVLRAFDRALAALPAVKPVAALAEITTALDDLRADGRTNAALLADIYARPEDDAPRAVYADLALAQGDPRGELIMLQLARTTDEPSAREVELLAKHGKAWLGALAAGVSWGKSYSHSEFRRGFLAIADIMLSVGNKLRPTYGDPMWTTVEELQGTWNLELLERAPLRSLRELDSYLDARDVVRLAQRAEPLAAMHSIAINVARELADWDLLDAALVHRAFPNLRELVCYREITTCAELASFAAIGIRSLAIDHYQHTGRHSLADATAAFDALVAELRTAPLDFDALTLRAPWNGRPGPEPRAMIRTADGWR